MSILPSPYVFLKLQNLDETEINSVVGELILTAMTNNLLAHRNKTYLIKLVFDILDIQCRVMRDYGLSSGITNDRSWIKRELHVLEGNYQCRLSLWNKQVFKLIEKTFCTFHAHFIFFFCSDVIIYNLFILIYTTLKIINFLIIGKDL
jgi:hypothetical protein